MEHFGAGQIQGTCKLLISWSGRPDSNRRRPAWEHGTSLCLQHLRVSDALFRLTQVSLYQSFPGLTLLIEVGSRYIVFLLIPFLGWYTFLFVLRKAIRPREVQFLIRQEVFV